MNKSSSKSQTNPPAFPTTPWSSSPQRRLDGVPDSFILRASQALARAHLDTLAAEDPQHEHNDTTSHDARQEEPNKAAQPSQQHPRPHLQHGTTTNGTSTPAHTAHHTEHTNQAVHSARHTRQHDDRQHDPHNQRSATTNTPARQARHTNQRHGTTTATAPITKDIRAKPKAQALEMLSALSGAFSTHAASTTKSLGMLAESYPTRVDMESVMERVEAKAAAAATTASTNAITTLLTEFMIKAREDRQDEAMAREASLEGLAGALRTLASSVTSNTQEIARTREDLASSHRSTKSDTRNLLRALEGQRALLPELYYEQVVQLRQLHLISHLRK